MKGTIMISTSAQRKSTLSHPNTRSPGSGALDGSRREPVGVPVVTFISACQASSVRSR